ncbi:hypothetical protein FLAG1_05164 [Fusarium langsethiae]|uniref:Uncharacterized protein n=1 Tax=Fusarium langsethiae TaxID=179993 RepID=A0A0M9EXJ3_FUSLA|nr:hypothetical protein FLAG1_05164 [Fusarium langsethiae]GKU02647.1 unnamed protein product [Fusarium langsethiae]GKU19864.1 unnamed protein product [Fusarium langsethiae]
MTKSSNDFVESLHALFREAGLKGRNPETEFIHLRSNIVEFISNRNRTTPTRANRPPFQFTDGSKPETRLASLSPDMGIDEKRTQLNAANTASEFLEVLKGRNEHKSARKDSKKKTSGKKRSISPPESPKSKVQKRLEAAAASKTIAATKDSPKKRIKFTKGGAKDASSSLVPKTAQQTNNNIVTKPTKIGESPNQAIQETLIPKETNPSSGKLAGNNGTTTTQSESNEKGADSSAMFPKPSHSEEDAPREDASVTSTDNHLPPFCRSDILDVVTAVKDVTANQWDGFKPTLLGMLDKLRGDPTPEQEEAAERRLRSAIASIEQERSLIPTEAWARYEEKLVKKAKDGVFDADWSTRLSKISRIIWLEEEEAAMRSKDWNRLRAAARTWTILAEVAGPMMEDGDEQRSNEWLIEKLGDIDFLERLFASKERLAAIKA